MSLILKCERRNLITGVKLYYNKQEEPNEKTWSSYKGRKGNALALGAEEGRNKLRKAMGSRK